MKICLNKFKNIEKFESLKFPRQNNEKNNLCNEI